MNKIKTYIICVPIIMGILGSYCLGLREWGHGELEADFPYESSKVSNSCDSTTDLGNCTSIKENKETIIVGLLKVFGLNNDTEKERDLKFIDYAKAILNITLGLIAFIALIMSIYTFYMMIFSENEAGIKKAKGNLTGIFIALCTIGAARLIVSVIFWRYEKYRHNKEDVIPSMNVSMIKNEIIHNQIYPII